MVVLLPRIPNIQIETEDGQARFRLHATCVVGVVAAPLLLGLGVDRRVEALCGVAAYGSLAYFWVWLVALRLGPTDLRQWLALVLDHGVFAAVIAWGGGTMAPLLWFPATATVGHGLRFGEVRGVVGAVFGGLSLFSALHLSPFWVSGQ